MNAPSAPHGEVTLSNTFCTTSETSGEIFVSTHPNNYRSKYDGLDTDNLLKVYRLSDKATIPDRKSTSAAGYDLYSTGDYILPPNSHVLIPLDICVAIPYGYYGRIAPRSSLASQFTTIGGVLLIQIIVVTSKFFSLIILKKTNSRLQKETESLNSFWRNVVISQLLKLMILQNWLRRFVVIKGLDLQENKTPF